LVLLLLLLLLLLVLLPVLLLRCTTFPLLLLFAFVSFGFLLSTDSTRKAIHCCSAGRNLKHSDLDVLMSSITDTKNTLFNGRNGQRLKLSLRVRTRCHLIRCHAAAVRLHILELLAADASKANREEG
jgi:hypothetical protein